MCIITIALRGNFTLTLTTAHIALQKLAPHSSYAFTSYQAPDSSCCTRIRVRLFCFMKPSFFCPPSLSPSSPEPHSSDLPMMVSSSYVDFNSSKRHIWTKPVASSTSPESLSYPLLCCLHSAHHYVELYIYI